MTVQPPPPHPPSSGPPDGIAASPERAAAAAGIHAVLRVIDAAAALAVTHLQYRDSGFSDSELWHSVRAEIAEIAAASGDLEALVQGGGTGRWVPVTWFRVLSLGSGTRVRIGDAMAVVDSAEARRWGVDPATGGSLPRTVVQVALVTDAGRRVYEMPPDGPVEAWVPPTPPSGGDFNVWVAEAARAQEARGLRILAEVLGAEIIGGEGG